MKNAAGNDDLKPFVVRLLVAAAVASLLWIAWQLRALLMLLFGAILFAVILHLIARPFQRRLGLPPIVSLLSAVLLIAMLATMAFWLLGAELAHQTRSLEQLVPAALHSFQARLDSWGLGGFLRQWLDALPRMISNPSHLAVWIGNGLGNFILVIAGGIYLAAQPKLYRTGLLKLVPADRRALVGDALAHSGKALGLWLKGRLVSMALVGLLTGIGLWLIGVPAALSLAIFSALLEFIPFIGPIVSAVPAIILALAHSPDAAIWTALLYLGVQQLEGNVVEPLVQQQAVTIPPALLLFALIGAGILFGLVGILLGAPLAVVLFVLTKRLYVREALDTTTPLPTEPGRD